MSNTMFSDREYLNQKFQQVEEVINELRKDFSEVNKKIVGNGEEGLITKVANNKKEIETVKEVHKQSMLRISWMITATMAFLVLTHLESAAQLVTEFLKHNL